VALETGGKKRSTKLWLSEPGFQEESFQSSTMRREEIGKYFREKKRRGSRGGKRWNLHTGGRRKKKRGGKGENIDRKPSTVGGKLLSLYGRCLRSMKKEKLSLPLVEWKEKKSGKKSL